MDSKREIQRESLLTIIKNKRKGDVPLCGHVICRNCYYGKIVEYDTVSCTASYNDFNIDFESDYIREFGEESLIEELL